MSDTSSDIGLVGLAVMGQNLALNIADHGFRISVYNRTTSKTDKFVTANPDTPGGVVGTTTLEEFVQSIKRPRKIIILVQIQVRNMEEILCKNTFSRVVTCYKGPIWHI